MFRNVCGCINKAFEQNWHRPYLSLEKNHLKIFSNSDPDSYFHQNWINSSLSHTQCVPQVSSESIHNFLRYGIYHFWPYLSMVKNHLKVPVVASRSGSFPKSNKFVLVTHPTCPPNFIWIRPQLFKISYTQTNRQMKNHHRVTTWQNSTK